MPIIAIIKTGGKQYKVKEGQSLKVEKLKGEKGSEIKLETFLIADTNGEIKQLGKPSLGEKVNATILEQGKDKKISVIKYKPKTRYKRNLGHRQLFTKIKIAQINAD